MPRYRAVLILLLGLYPALAIGAPTDSLWQEYSRANNNETKVRLLIELATLYDGDDLQKQKDSIIDAAIYMATLTNSDELLVKAYNVYFDDDALVQPEKGSKRASNMLDIARRSNNNEWYYYAYTALSKTSRKQNNYNEALNNIQQAYYYVSLLPEDNLRAKCMMMYGKCQTQTNKKIEAFRNYLNALYIAEKNDNQKLAFETYGHLADFFLLLNNYEKAKGYNTRQITMLLSAHPVDSSKLMTAYNDLARLLFYNDEKEEAVKIIRGVITYAKQNKKAALLQSAISRYRTYLIEHTDLVELNNLYAKDYPEELNKLRDTDSLQYFRIKTYLYEVKGDIDSSKLYYQKAEAALKNKQYDNIYLSNFFKRYAQFYMRIGEIKNAIPQMEKALEYAKQATYLPYLIETTHLLDSLNYNIGDINKAYAYKEQNTDYLKQQTEINKSEDILRIDIDNEAKQKQLEEEKEIAATERRHNLQYMAITLLLGFSLLLLIILGAFKVNRLLIRSVGFFSFIFLFEFIVLLADNKIHHATHGEPWKVLSIKIVLIAIIFPLHHWLEEKVIHYLTTHNLINTSKLKLKIMKMGKKVEVNDSVNKDVEN